MDAGEGREEGDEEPRPAHHLNSGGHVIAAGLVLDKDLQASLPGTASVHCRVSQVGSWTKYISSSGARFDFTELACP